jgi:carbon monoxide dehydrogenase subunit G
MNLSGTYVVNAPAQAIWDILMDPDALARITPAITKLERIEGDTFKAIAEVKIGPMSGAFTGNLTLTDKVEPQSFNLNVQQNSKIGNASAVIGMNMKALSDTQTEVSFNGDVKLSGMLNTMGGRVITPVANMLSKQFFDALNEEVAKG